MEKFFHTHTHKGHHGIKSWKMYKIYYLRTKIGLPVHGNVFTHTHTHRAQWNQKLKDVHNLLPKNKDRLDCMAIFTHPHTRTHKGHNGIKSLKMYKIYHLRTKIGLTVHGNVFTHTHTHRTQFLFFCVCMGVLHTTSTATLSWTKSFTVVTRF